MARYGMVVNLDRCVGCYNCQIACKDEHVGNDFPPVAKSQPTFGHFWMGIEEVERVISPSHIRVTYIPVFCQQCADAPCIAAAKDGAVYRRDDGIVIIDPVKAVGQKQLAAACPYGVIFWNEESNIPQKCTFCAHLLDDGWKQPRCVQTCPAGCLSFGDLDDPADPAAKHLVETKAETWHPEFKAKPNVYYAGLPKPLLSGRVLFADRNEWAENVSVTLTSRAGDKRECRTDAFGDFAFERLEQKPYTLSLESAGYVSQVREVAVSAAISNLGNIELRK